MPRGPRLDAPGTLHHLIARGIERRNIVDDDVDRQKFVTRLGEVAVETDTSVYAWALLGNHVHLLVRSGPAGIATFMRRLLTGHAITYNLRHRRHGHLFQNRYKSIVCEEEIYFTELVRYIHLNPLRAGLVDSLAHLDRYLWCGHAVIMGRVAHPWQDRDDVLKWFGMTLGQAKVAYRQFVEGGVSQGHRPDLVGGGLIRSMGGWSVVKSLRRSGNKEQGDPRILGSGAFVRQVIEEAEQSVRCQLLGEDPLEAAEKAIEAFCSEHDLSIDAVRGGSRRREISRAREQLVRRLVNKLGLSLAETGRQLGLTTSGVFQILRRKG